ncbi:Nuclease-related domain-containing protein [Alkalibacterium subtropicum]|uniref:Nuclease-related domain-containing protein n=1 Tax=Alkalibacterium subtropicum TaxID=753702 RepID=A0A1I1GDR9_9LACT|nr:nuclease-related domain-containing protein [Alkalibacterium subtropicum]SFC09605.1 Nuclease-related domain-containing protein [Alkalibacterium subtropicum]
MILKERTKSVNHLIYESLNSRMTLSSYEKVQYDNQVKGFLGEQVFDDCMKTCQPDGLIIQDLLLSTRDTFYQIDSLLITPNHIYLYEVKNYSGSYHYKDGMIQSEAGYALQDPVAQADRKRAYLYNLLLNHGMQTEVSSHVVFINPDFYIYAFPEQKAVLFSGQLSAHFKNLYQDITAPGHLSTSIADKLIRMHITHYRPTNLPDYSFDQLKKGIVCPNCFSFRHTHSRQTRTCLNCGAQEKISEAIHRSIEEYRLLFPDTPVKKADIYEWCGHDLSKSRIQTVLKTHYCRKQSGLGSYYD